MGNIAIGPALAKALLDDLIDEPNFSMVVTKKMWQQIRQRVAVQYGPCNDTLTEFLDTYPHVFSYEDELDIHNHRRITVSVDPTLRVCPHHIRRPGTCGASYCNSLHCCKHYLSGTCRFGENCKFGHNLMNERNQQVLVAHYLENIAPPKLGELLKFAEDQETEEVLPNSCPPVPSLLSIPVQPHPLPSVHPGGAGPVSAAVTPKCCQFYNSNKGCRHGDTDRCRNVHICRHYMLGNCQFGGRECQYSHDCHNPQAKAVLLKFGINSDKMRVNDILEKMRAGAQPERANDVSRASSSSDISNSGAVMSGGFQGSSRASRDSESPDEDKDPEICIFYLRDKCNYTGSCKRYHTQLKLPYHWQHKASGPSGRWTDFPNQCQAEMEHCYCDPVKEECFAQDNGLYKITFKDMKYTVKGDQQRKGRPQTGDVRRLCTKASVGVVTEQHQYTTLWRWYWIEDDSRWIEFGYTKHGTKVHGSLSSRDIEEEFTSNPESNISYSRGRFPYEMHLQSMKQVNVGTQKEREIRRRPAPFDHTTRLPIKHGFPEKNLHETPVVSSGRRDEMVGDVAVSIPSLLTGKSADAFHAGKTIYPTYWTSTSTASYDGFQIVPIHPNGATVKEYADISQLFKVTMPEIRVKSIRRIQNVELWDAFYRKKSWMEKKLQSSNAARVGNEGDAAGGGPRGVVKQEGGRRRARSAGRCKAGGDMSVFTPPSGASLNVQRLFHGTKKSVIDAICQQGFDWRLNGTAVGTIYGKGSYFARQASYSASFTDCRTLFVAQVLVGTFAQGLPALVRPPPKNPNKPLLDLYDSCVDNMVEPNIFVVFAQEQAYPEYLIDYFEN